MSFSFLRKIYGRLKALSTTAIFALIAAAYAGCGKHASPVPILLFNGNGGSVNDVAAIKTILDKESFDYETLNSEELNGMSRQQLAKYRLLIVPGGNFITMGKSLDTATGANIRYAVQHGLNYHGICAGAFLAGKSAYYNGFNLTSGTTFGFYAAENQGIRKAAVPISSAGGATLEQYWEDGPQLAGWGAVVAKYPDGTPAVAEGKYGKGFVLLTGIHAEAPGYWRGIMAFHTSTGDDNAYAAKLIRAALNGNELRHY
jgi:glutamine amidotransferase-like uncharacterized protein